MRWSLIVCSLVVGAVAVSPYGWTDELRGHELRMNHIQVVGTHNSYHQRPDPILIETITAFVPEAEAWDYSHAPLPEQLDVGVRNFELDLYRYADGYRVLHVPHFDAETSCYFFKDCLEAIVGWSKANPGHLPISVLIEIKAEEARLSPEPTLPLDEEGFLALDKEIRAVIPEEMLITPDIVRGDAESLEAAVLEKGWPSLEWSRGKIFFNLHERGALRQAYIGDTPDLEGRAMFVRSDPGDPLAAILIRDNPYSEDIPDLVKQGYIVRTRTDSGLRQGRSGDTSRRDQGFASGAHILSTDFPEGGAHEDTGYVVRIENGKAARCNPVNAPEICEEYAHTFVK